jgi:hypothetical protein
LKIKKDIIKKKKKKASLFSYCNKLAHVFAPPPLLDLVDGEDDDIFLEGVLLSACVFQLSSFNDFCCDPHPSNSGFLFCQDTVDA